MAKEILKVAITRAVKCPMDGKLTTVHFCEKFCNNYEGFNRNHVRCSFETKEVTK